MLFFKNVLEGFSHRRTGVCEVAIHWEKGYDSFAVFSSKIAAWINVAILRTSSCTPFLPMSLPGKI